MATNSSSANPMGARDPSFDAIPLTASNEVLSHAHETTSSTDLKGADHASGEEKKQENLPEPVADMKAEMEGLGRSEVAKRG